MATGSNKNKGRAGLKKAVLITAMALFFCLLPLYVYAYDGTALIIPTAPHNLVATAVNSRQINLTWQTGTSTYGYGFMIERANAVTGPFIQIGGTPAKAPMFNDTTVLPGHTYYYRVYAFSGAIKSAYSNIASAIMPPDTIPPTGSIKINNGDQCAQERTCMLTLSATDNASGVNLMQFSNDQVSWAAPQAFQTRSLWKLSQGDGLKTVYVKFSDNAGNWSRAYSAYITLDTTPPTGTITIDDGAAYTNLVNARLGLSAVDQISGMRSGAKMLFSNDNITWSSPEAYNTYKYWPLKPGDGPKTVYVKFIDAAGNCSASVSANITLDTTPPVIVITYPQNNAVIDAANVTVQYTCDSVPKTKQVALEFGLNNILIQETDRAGNTSEVCLKVSRAIHDTHPPTGSIIINNSAQYANDRQVSLTLAATDDFTGVNLMTFSNDNITWSEPENFDTGKTWMLAGSNGPKTVYVKFSDMAGNWSQAYSATIMLNKGTLIDPVTGGEVLSPDGKARLEIPPNAFLGTVPSPISISIEGISLSGLTCTRPSEYRVATAVKCEPTGTDFTIPAQLIISLDQPEVPGTPMCLGCDVGGGKYAPLSTTSAVGTDGYTLKFDLYHFSSYAGLASMISQGAPIGVGVQIPLPDMLTGSFSHSIALTVPPGRKGLAPHLTLQYRSSNPNSWLGMGWSLTPGYIVRSTKLGLPSYVDENDTYIFVTDSGSTELTHLIDNLYQAKIESSFAKFYKQTDDSWQVIQKDGTILLFGQDTYSKEVSGKGTFLWNLTKITDNNSNYIALSYSNDNGKSYLDHIDYTGHTSASPSNTIQFTLEDRSDKTSSYISTSKITTAKRLSKIDVLQNGNTVWTYTLDYGDPSPDTKRSLLRSITQKAGDGTSFPAQTFTYQSSND